MGRITENTPQYAGVVVLNMSGTPLGAYWRGRGGGRLDLATAAPSHTPLPAPPALPALPA